MIFTEAFSPTSKAKINSSGDREWVLWGRAEPKICVCGKGKHVHQISGGMFECWVQHVGGGRGVGGYINLGAIKSLLLCSKCATILVSHINLLCMVSAAVPKIIYHCPFHSNSIWSHTTCQRHVRVMCNAVCSVAMHWMKCQRCIISQLQTCRQWYPHILGSALQNMSKGEISLLLSFTATTCWHWWSVWLWFLWHPFVQVKHSTVHNVCAAIYPSICMGNGQVTHFMYPEPPKCN